MKINRLKLRNHVRFKDLDLDLNSPDVVSIIGVNGSGKSFLISSFHPYSSDNRYFKTYSFIEGEVGYKEIEFADNDTRYICKHEYIPKGRSHACKSYLTKICSDGNEIELNPTGHNEMYKEMVKKHLKFSQATFDVGMISFESRGVIASSPTNRKKVLEATIDLEYLNKLKKKAVSLNKEYSSFAKLTFKNRSAILNTMNVEEIKDEIVKLKKEKEDYDKFISDYGKELLKYESELSEIENVDISNLDILTNAFKYFSKRKNENGIKILDDIDNNIEKLSNLQSNILIKIDALQNKEKIFKSYQANKTTLDNSNKRVKELTKNISDMNSELKALVEDASDINSIRRSFVELQGSLRFVKRELSIKDIDMAKLRLKELSDEIAYFDDIKSKFISCKDICGENMYEPKVHEVCKNCDLNNYYGEASKYIQEHKSDYERYIRCEVELKDEKAELQTAIKMIDEISKSAIISNLSNLKLGLNLNKILELHNENRLASLVEGRISDIALIKDGISSIQIELNELNASISSITKMLESVELSDEFDSDELNNLRNELTSIVERLDTFKAISKYIGLEGLDKNDKIRRMASEELIEHYNKVTNSDTLKKSISNKITIAKSNIEKYENNSKFNLTQVISLEEKLKNYNKLDAEYKEYSSTNEKLSRVRELLEKDIPIMLMAENLRFIEDTTNSLLAENDINLSISIEATDTEIKISGLTKDVEVEDISMLSSGEKCLVSLLLNASILHLLGYPILCLDEIDANLSTNNTAKFSSIIYNILNNLCIEQVICISHSINTTSNLEATKILIGDGDLLDVDTSDAIKI